MCGSFTTVSGTLFIQDSPQRRYTRGKGICVATRRMTRHVATVPYTMADLFPVHEGSPCMESLSERATNKIDLLTN